MRRIAPLFPVLLVVFLLEGQVQGFASAPGTYPEEETKAGNDMEMPKNPYQNGWTGYDFYYEKEPKPATGGSGKMPAFQSIESVDTDRESPEDPSGYQASGSESGPKARPTTAAPKTTVPTVAEKLEVAPSTSTKGPTTTTHSPTTTEAPPSSVPPTTEPHAPVPAPEKEPDSGSDLSAADDMLYGGGGAEQKGSIAPPSHDPPPPPPPAQPIPVSTLTKKSHPGDDDLGGPSGYEMRELGSSSKWSKAPGAQPKSPDDGLKVNPIQTVEPEGPDYGQNIESKSSGTPAPGGRSPGSQPYNSYGSKQSEGPYSTRVTSSTPGSHREPYGESDGGSQRGSHGGYQGGSNGGSVGGFYEGSHGGSPGEPYKASHGSRPSENHNPKPPATQKTPTPHAYSHQKASDPYQPRVTAIPNDLGSEPRATSSHAPTLPESLHHTTALSNPRGSEDALSFPDLPDAYHNPTKHFTAPRITPARGFYGNPENPRISESQGKYETPNSSSGYSPPSNKVTHHGNAPGSEPSVPAASGYPDVLDYGSRPNNHIGKMASAKPTTTHDTWDYSNSNNALSPRDPYDHFGRTVHHVTLAPPPAAASRSFNRGNFEETSEDELDGGYGTNDIVIVPLRSSHSTTSTNTEVRAQISEIDRIAESFENSAREPVEYEQKITSESSKGITVEAGKDIMKHFGRKARKCCSCCDEKQPVSRNIETKVEPLHVQQAVDPSRQLAENDPVQNYVPLQNTIGGNAYVQQPAVHPPQTQYQQPFQQYQPQYPQSYPYQQPSCGCQPQPQNCCAPPAPCCLPTIPCCPPIPCCPQPKICCQPTPICLPPQQCCSINFKLPTIPICGRACPSCPCRRRVHKSLRLKRHAISSNCHQCSAAGEPWKAVVHHREKRAAPGCSSGFSTMQQNSCGNCGASHLRSTRVKRMGCLPCLGRKKRDTDSHLRVKRMGCLPCLGRKKRSALSSPSGCSQCNSLGHLFTRYKRSLFGCSPCAPQPPCGCQGRKKRSVTVKIVKRAPEKCDATCCDYSK
uniref:GATA-type domain-containing protein n=1 Tax=Caenorhabditis tropicalis TaxID=1561998 RepID=A0A1I7TQ42_9PELO